MATSAIAKADVINIYKNYWKFKQLIPNLRDQNEVVRLNTLLTDIKNMLTAINTDWSYSIQLTQPCVVITPYDDGTRPYKVKSGQAISYTVEVTGGETALTAVEFTAKNLPSWITFNKTTGAMTGTAPALSSVTFDAISKNVANLSDNPLAILISAKNAFGEAVNGPMPFPIKIVHASTPSVSSGATGAGTAGGALTKYTIAASGTPTKFTAYGLSKLNLGETPGTVALNATTGDITGNLGSDVAAGDYVIYVSGTNAYGEGPEKKVTITISA